LAAGFLGFYLQDFYRIIVGENTCGFNQPNVPGSGFVIKFEKVFNAGLFFCAR
jgi:hypothetical protein